MFTKKGKMSVLDATVRFLKRKPDGATWAEIYKGVSKNIGYQVNKDNVRAVVYRKTANRNKNPVFTVENSIVKLLK